MSTQLDILALEPFYGGARKAMLETIMRYSRHRWTLLRLPPRRIERRLEAAAHWFAEQILRHWAGRVDLLFCSEAMNLADLLRLAPLLSGKPAVVYFHDNQLPLPTEDSSNPLDVVNLATASVATELWFNSLYHLRTFMKKASALVEKHPELAAMNPLPQLTGKAQLMPPPVDLTMDRDVLEKKTIQRDPRMLFVDTRGADIKLLNVALGALGRRGEKFNLTTVGPVEGLDAELPRQTIGEEDEMAHIQAVHQASVMVSARVGAVSDHYAIRGLHAGCWPVFPDSGVYPELLPSSLHSLCLYDGGSSARLVTQLQNFWWMEQPRGYQEELAKILSRYDALEACHAMDMRLEHLAVSHGLHAKRP